MKNKEFDPDRLVLTKQDILDFCDRVIEKWQKDSTKDQKHTLAMNAVKMSIYWTDDESLKIIWSKILHWTYELLYENAIAQAGEENIDWSTVMKQIKKKH